MPVCWNVRNPESVASSRYGPIGRFDSDVVAVCVGDRGPREAGVGLRRGDVDAGQHAAARSLARCR